MFPHNTARTSFWRCCVSPQHELAPIQSAVVTTVRWPPTCSNATSARCVEPEIQHTDRGSQYSADDYLTLLKGYGIQVSMSGKGDPYDNAMMESFFSTLRAELTNLERFAARRTARTAVFEFIEVFARPSVGTIVSGYIRRRATASHWHMKATIYPEGGSYLPSTKTGQDHD